MDKTTEQKSKVDPSMFQLDQLIDDLYSYVYENRTDDFEVKIMDASKLDLNRFKFQDYDLNTIFNKTKTKFTGVTPIPIGADQMIIKRKGESHMTSIRFIPYRSKKSIDDVKDPVNVNQIIKTLLSELVLNGQTNNIILPIINVDVLADDMKDYEVTKDLVDIDKYVWSVQLVENFYSLTNLETFMMENALTLEVWKSILYQIVDVMYQINRVYPEFRHNRLTPPMIDCYLRNIDDIIFPDIKLNNFFLSEIGDMVINDAARKFEVPIFNTPYSDLYQFLNYLIQNREEDIKKYPELVKFMDSVLPKKLRMDDIYLRESAWNSLTSDEKEELNLKNIRNHEFLADIKKKGEFVETAVGGSDVGQFSTEMSNLDQVYSVDDEESLAEIVEDEANEDMIEDREVPEEYYDLSYDAVEDMKKLQDSLNGNLDSTSSRSHKKSSINDIGMSNKKRQTKYSNSPSDEGETVSIRSDSENVRNSRSSQKRVSTNKLKNDDVEDYYGKVYRGKREIMTPDSLIRVKSPQPQESFASRVPPMQMNNGYSMNDLLGSTQNYVAPSTYRNSMADLLGSHQNDVSPNTNYKAMTPSLQMPQMAPQQMMPQQMYYPQMQQMPQAQYQFPQGQSVPMVPQGQMNPQTGFDQYMKTVQSSYPQGNSPFFFQ